MEELNIKLAKKLITKYPIKEGCLFGVDIVNDNFSWAANTQMNFLEEIILDVKPTNIIEIGTHCGFFFNFFKTYFRL